jgi:hypothetical protein
MINILSVRCSLAFAPYVPCLHAFQMNASEKPAGKDACAPRMESLEVKRTEDFLLLLSPATGACVALDQSELARLSE